MAESFDELKSQEHIALSEQKAAEAEIELGREQLAGLHLEQERLLKLLSVLMNAPQSDKTSFQRDGFASDLAKIDASIAAAEQKSRDALKREASAKAKQQEIQSKKMRLAAEQAKVRAEEKRRQQQTEKEVEHAPAMEFKPKV